MTNRSLLFSSLLKVVPLSLLGSSVAVFFGRFLQAQGMNSDTFIFLFFIILVVLIFLYRIEISRKRKKSLIMLFLIYFFVFIFCSLFRSFIFERIVAFLGITTGALYTFYVSNSNSYTKMRLVSKLIR